jgi:hypothetical protein
MGKPAFRHLGTVGSMESSTPRNIPGNFEPILRYRIGLGRVDIYLKPEWSSFCSSDAVGCGIESENSIVTGAIY